MKIKRRDFIKVAGVAGAGMIAGGMTTFKDSFKDNNHRRPKDSFRRPEDSFNYYHNRPDVPRMAAKEHKQLFNMSGFSAPKLDVVRVGYIGIGNRGLGSVQRTRLIEGVEIKALCDILSDRVNMGQKALKDMGMPAARTYVGSEVIWKEMVKSEDLDLIFVETPRDLHPEMCIGAMENGKHVVSEIPGVQLFEDTWKLVEASEKAKKHYMMLENCTYDFYELLVLNMARQGFFGEIVHANAGYCHDQREINLNKDKLWRTEEFCGRNGNIYPTHGLGPVCQAMNINRGDRLDYLTSMSSNEFTMGQKIAERAKTDDSFKKYVNKWTEGNMNTSTIRTVKGKTIMLQFNISNPRPYDRLQTIIGTKAITQKYPEPFRVSQGDEKWFNDKEVGVLVEKYTPPIIKIVGEMAKKVGGHGGMDFLIEWRLIDCLRNGLPLDMDVYDAAAWSSLVPLSEWSVANGSNPIKVPDYTCGSYKTNAPVDIEMLRGGGNTSIKPIPAK